jgi:hypothetical protein
MWTHNLKHFISFKNNSFPHPVARMSRIYLICYDFHAHQELQIKLIGEGKLNKTTTPSLVLCFV